jgi:hypothetical protein
MSIQRCMILMNRQQFIITDEGRDHKILKYIISNQGCTRADITRELERDVSKKTIDKYVKKMITEGKIEEKREKENSRDIRLYAREDNPAVYVPLQLEEIEKIFRKLLYKSEKCWQDLKKWQDEVWTKKLTTQSIADLVIESLGVKSWVDFVPTMILRIITDSITIHSTTIWKSKFRDRDTLNKLFAFVFLKLASLNSDYVKFLTNIRHNHSEKVMVDSAAANRILSPLQLMYASRKIYTGISMKKEVEEMLDLLWKFNEDIQKFLFPEIELYKWDFKYNGDDNWRKLLEIYENNPNQTTYNYYHK